MLHSYACVYSTEPNAIAPRTSTTFSATEIAKIYGFPAPSPVPVVVGVISLGGGLFGTLDSSGILRNGDVQAYWSAQGISAENHPTVVIVGLNGAVNRPSTNDGNSTLENTIDVEKIGSCCPTANLTIILYIVPNSQNDFYNVFQYAINTPVNVRGVLVKPTILSCSWGLTEMYASSTLLTNLNNLLKTASERGINVCAAAGDYGSSNGAPGINVDFPGSSPHIICCGGTRLVSPNKVYDTATTETVWNNNPTTSATGGGISKVFASPSYQSFLSLTKRAVPDIALNSDPSTGVRFLMNGSYTTVGGTSIAAPAFAAFLACIQPTTFMLPLLYSYPRSCFHDIVSGNNGAYSAGIGYDKCSGLGSVNGKVLAPFMTQTVVTASSISVAPGSVNATTRTPIQLVATILPANTTDKTVTWRSGNTAVATVSASGLITPIANGTTTVTATTSNGRSASIPVTVTVTIPVTSLTQSIVLSTVHATMQLSATIQPVNATNLAVTWSSSAPAVATVSATGLVTARAVGNTVITSRTQDGTRSSTLNVTVAIPSNSRPRSTNILQSLADRRRAN